jgi:probable F420-dependent oxidoreductase
LSNNKRITVGVVVPQDGFRYEEIIEAVRTYEEIGFDSLWCNDHFYPYDGSDKKKEFHEPMTLLGALSALTKRVRLGTLVLCASFRNPGLIAKMAAELDVISKGRLELGLGAGWFREEFEAYGFEFGTVQERLLRLEESLKIIKGLWTQAAFSFEGRLFRLREAYCYPKPVQKPHPPIWLGGSLKEILRLAALYADGWNLGFYASNTPKGFAEKSKALDDICLKLGRDPLHLRRSWHGLVIFGKDREAVKEGIKRHSWMAMGYPYIAGTADECVAVFRSYIAAGATDFIIKFPEPMNYDLLANFFEAVVPSLR